MRLGPRVQPHFTNTESQGRPTPYWCYTTSTSPPRRRSHRRPCRPPRSPPGGVLSRRRRHTLSPSGRPRGVTPVLVEKPLSGESQRSQVCRYSGESVPDPSLFPRTIVSYLHSVMKVSAVSPDLAYAYDDDSERVLERTLATTPSLSSATAGCVGCEADTGLRVRRRDALV